MNLLTFDKFITFQRMLGLISNSHKEADESLPVFTDEFCSHICEKSEKRVFLELLLLRSWYIGDMGLLAFYCCSRCFLHKCIIKDHISISMCACDLNSIVCFLFIYESLSVIKETRLWKAK
jgi:hypothetical protein